VADLTAVSADLRAESAELDSVVAALSDAEFSRATPAEGWTIAHQIAHLAWTDEVATLAATDPAEFQAELARALEHFDGYVDRAAEQRAQQPPRLLVTTWRDGRAALAAALSAVPAGTKLPWFGPPMSAASMATARLMETWAHGQDILDTVGITRRPTARLRHVAHLGVRTRDFAYLVRDRVRPTAEFRIELTGPAGEDWTWGPEDAAQRVSGPALDFCLLVTRRRHRDDLALKADGPDADEWLNIAQAFAGPPGTPRSPLRASR
jgi:uncharacterized protein (TIGR03084 family)